MTQRSGFRLGVGILMAVATGTRCGGTDPDRSDANRSMALARHDSIPVVTSSLLRDTVRIPVRRLFGDAATWGYPMRLRLVGHYLVVHDRLAQDQVAVVDLRSGAVVKRGGRAGDGPRELRDITGLASVYDSARARSVVEILDPTLRRVSTLDPTLAPESMIVAVRSLEFPEYPRVHGYLDSELVAVGLFRAGPVGIASQGEKRFRQFLGAYPYVPPENPAGAGRLIVNMGELAIAPARDRFAVAFASMNRIDFFEASGGHTGSARPGGFDTSFVHYDHGKTQIEGRQRIAFTGIAASDRFVYVLFCNCTPKESAYGTAEPQLMVLTWTGELIAQAILEPMTAGGGFLEVTADDRLLYANVLEPYPAVGEWDLGILRLTERAAGQ